MLHSEAMFLNTNIRWDRPDEAVAAAMESRLREEEQRVEQAVQVVNL